MNDNQLTDRNFWLKYWQSKPDLIFEVPANYPFVADLGQLIDTHKVKSLIEIGGFPGHYSAWAIRKKKIDCTLLDYVIHEPIVHELEKANHIPEGAIDLLETDLFSVKPSRQYDMAFSNGLVEHFQDTADIVGRHAQFLKPGGVLYFTIPNFRSLNGWFQKTFDPANYAKHNISCMDRNHLRKACEEAGLEDIEVRYEGYFMLWLEDAQSKPTWLRWLRTAIWLPIKVFFKIFPFNSRAFSPYISVKARKKS